MKNFGYYERIIATGDRSNGNDSVGDMWTVTKSFDKSTSISDIVKWARDSCVSGKLIITIDEFKATP